MMIKLILIEYQSVADRRVYTVVGLAKLIPM
jgi:hypothetical protein